MRSNETIPVAIPGPNFQIFRHQNLPQKPMPGVIVKPGYFRLFLNVDTERFKTVFFTLKIPRFLLRKTLWRAVFS